MFFYIVFNFCAFTMTLSVTDSLLFSLFKRKYVSACLYHILINRLKQALIILCASQIVYKYLILISLTKFFRLYINSGL